MIYTDVRDFLPSPEPESAPLITPQTPEIHQQPLLPSQTYRVTPGETSILQPETANRKQPTLGPRNKRSASQLEKMGVILKMILSF